MSRDDKQQVQEFWQQASCGERLYLDNTDRDGFAHQAEVRYRLEPYILPFADFSRWQGKRVLEIGVGLGADHQRFAEAGAQLVGIDLTQHAIEMVRHRMAVMGLASQLMVGDAERLPFPDNHFDLVYSWGVIHHSPDTDCAAREILRVLKPGGCFRVMIYHRYAMVGYMLWLRYALLTGRLWLSLDAIYARYLESPGTKAYSLSEAEALFSTASKVQCRVELTHGDLLSSAAGQRHRGGILSLARALWPRTIIQRYFARHGLFLLIKGEK